MWCLFDYSIAVETLFAYSFLPLHDPYYLMALSGLTGHFKSFQGFSLTPPSPQGTKICLYNRAEKTVLLSNFGALGAHS
jgi:hypothetical protein